MVKTGQVWSGLIVTKDATGALATPSLGPAGVLYVDGVANGAAVTISGSNPYKWSVTLPSLTAGQSVSMYVTATIATIATASVVAENVADTVRLSDTPAVNVTLWAGAAVADPPLSAQETADALLLAPVGAAADGSAMDYLADILEDTGTTLPAAILAISQTVNSSTDSTAAGSIARRRGDSWSISLTVGAITGYTSLWFTAKWDRDNTDAQSVLQIKKNASGIGDGLMCVNGATAADATKASITISDASTGAIVIAVDETVTDDLPPAGIYYDIQVLVSGTVSTPDSGTLTITADVTRSIS